jgi:lipoate-protein ligase A
MVAALNVAEAKLVKRALDSAAQRVVTLKELLGATPSIDQVKRALLEGFAERLGISSIAGDITALEEALAAKYHDEEIGTDRFVAEIDDPQAGDGVRSATVRSAGGLVTACVHFERGRGDRIRDVLFTGDFFVTPPRTIFDLESALRGMTANEAGAAVEAFFARASVGLLSVSPVDFRRAIETAIAVGA